MSELPNVAKRILQLKGDMTYAELAADVKRKTGKTISDRALQALGSGRNQQGRPSTLQLLAEYAGVSLQWFFETGDPAQSIVAEACATYMTPTGDPAEDRIRYEILSAFNRDIAKIGRDLTAEDFEILANLARDLAKRRKSSK